MAYDSRNLIRSSAWGASFAVLFIAVATIVGELWSPFKDFLASTFSHHWIGKGVLSGILFLVVAIFASFFSRFEEKRVSRSFALLFWTTLVCYLALFGFFLYEAFGK